MNTSFIKMLPSRLSAPSLEHFKRLQKQLPTRGHHDSRLPKTHISPYHYLDSNPSAAPSTCGIKSKRLWMAQGLHHSQVPSEATLPASPCQTHPQTNHTLSCFRASSYLRRSWPLPPPSSLHSSVASQLRHHLLGEAAFTSQTKWVTWYRHSSSQPAPPYPFTSFETN